MVAEHGAEKGTVRSAQGTHKCVYGTAFLFYCFCFSCSSRRAMDVGACAHDRRPRLTTGREEPASSHDLMPRGGNSFVEGIYQLGTCV